MQGSVRNMDELFLPPTVADPATIKDLVVNANRPLALMCIQGGFLGNRVQYLHSSPGDKIASPTRVPGGDLRGENLYLETTPNGHEDEAPSIMGSVATRARGNRIRQPVRQPSPFPNATSLAIPSQSSEITLCGSIASNGEYKLEEATFPNECNFIQNIGEGGFGKVELHQHRKSKQLVVLKRVCHSDEYIKGLPAEVFVLRDVIDKRHDRLPQLFHVNTSLAEIKMWQDYCDGGDLHELGEYFVARRRSIPEGFIWHILTQMSSALAYLHTGLLDRNNPDLPAPSGWQPVIHRDVKPENIFLKLVPTEKDLYPNIVLGDFGLATTKRQTGSEGCLCGTPQWQPPELPIQSMYADIWAAGAIVHYLALGAPPLRAKPADYRYEDKYWEREPAARFVHHVTAAGYSTALEEGLGEWLNWGERERPAGLRGVLRAEAGRLMFLAGGGEQASLGSWWGHVRRAGMKEGNKRGTGAMGFER